MLAETVTLITVYRLPTKEKNLPFPFSVCRKQKEVCHRCFLFAANKQKLPFSVQISIDRNGSRYINIFMYIYIYIYIYIYT
jgi:hypothetical protein